MFNLLDVVLLLGLFLAGALFWNWRRQDEWARQHAAFVCKQNQIQLLDVARANGRPTFQGGLAWRAQFHFGFSSDGESRYEGLLTLHNLRLEAVQLPPHRMPEPSTPVSYEQQDTY